MAVQHELSQVQQTEQLPIQISELAQKFDLDGIELARYLPEFLEWYLVMAKTLSETGLAIVTVAGRNSSGKSSVADVIENLLRVDPESLRESLAGDKKYAKLFEYLVEHSLDIEVANCSITLVLESAKRQGIVPEDTPIGGLDEDQYRKVTAYAYELVQKKLNDGYSKEKPLVIIIQQGVPTIYPDESLNEIDFSDAESRKMTFPEFQKHWRGRDRLTSLSLFLAMHPDYSTNTFPIFLLRSDKVLERGITTRKTLQDLSVNNPYQRIVKGNLSPIIFRTPDQNVASETLPNEIVNFVEKVITIGQMPPDRIKSVTAQQASVIKHFGTTEEGLYRELLEKVGRSSVDSSVYIAENELIPVKDMPINLRLLLFDLAVQDMPQHFGLTPEILANFKQQISESIAQSRSNYRRLPETP